MFQWFSLQKSSKHSNGCPQKIAKFHSSSLPKTNEKTNSSPLKKKNAAWKTNYFPFGKTDFQTVNCLLVAGLYHLNRKRFRSSSSPINFQLRTVSCREGKSPSNPTTVSKVPPSSKRSKSLSVNRIPSIRQLGGRLRGEALPRKSEFLRIPCHCCGVNLLHFLFQLLSLILFHLAKL